MTITAFLLPAMSALLGCATAAHAPIDLSHADIVDLTYPFDEHTLYWPNSPSAFELKRLAYGPTPGGYFYSSNSFCAPDGGHEGTIGRRTRSSLELSLLHRHRCCGAVHNAG